MMLFYESEVEILCDGVEPERIERVERAKTIQLQQDIFFVAQEKSCHIAVSSIMYPNKKAVLCIAAQKNALSTDAIAEFMKAVGLEAQRSEVQEITFEVYYNMLSTAYRNNFIENDNRVHAKLGVTDLSLSYMHNDCRFSEALLFNNHTKKELLQKACVLLCKSSLCAEIERIYQRPLRSAIGHPVHYLIQSDDWEARSQILQVLLTSLYQNGRIQSRRYVEINFKVDLSYPESKLRTLYESCDGGTIIAYFPEGEPEGSPYARSGTGVISGLCSLAHHNRNKVLTIFCLKQTSEKLRSVFQEHLGTITIVPITQEKVFDENAKGYLHSLAKKNNVSPNKALYKKLTPGRGYNAVDLNLMFDEWYDNRLKSLVYTQYSGLDAANKQFALDKPKGSSIEELESMIGLVDAKRVIHQALDFYKAQRLFREKGFSSERPAMHMVFTGNPGTAKTTVARLFAQIMKDNGLLSVGDLYEVGRADLVGKYVGWTAQTVKDKFKSAKGSVLFIDEAYSLVDDRSGMYGDEAINTIVQEMENHREDMIVIFAGYPDKMEGFLKKNPGLHSRIAFNVPFADYSTDELYRITELMADRKNLKLEAGVNEKLTDIYEAAIKTDDFGNGRYARNLFERAIMNQASRLVAMDVDNVTYDDIERLIPEDFEAPTAIEQEARRIGF